MGRGNKGDSKNGKDGLDSEDLRLWKDFTRDIDPLEELGRETMGALFPPAAAQQKSGSEQVLKKNTVPTSTQNARPLVRQPPQLDLRTELRLRRGQMPIDGRLDLHGLNQEQAHSMLNQFVMTAHANGKRCLLIITGKGRGGLRAEDAYAPDLQPGILKQKLPEWLSMHPLERVVLKIMTAAPKDGGGGAFYIYLKRQRDYTP